MSTDRFAPADAALKAGKFDEAVAITERLLTEDPAAPLQVYRNFATLLVRRKAYEKAQEWAARGTERFPRDIDLLNLLGVSLRRLGRHDEAITVYSRALKLEPKNRSVLSNLGNVYNDVKNPAAIDVFTRLVRAAPSDAELQRSLGRAFWFAGQLDKAETRFNLATKLKPSLVDAWLDLASVATEARPTDSNLEIIERALAANPGDPRLTEARIIAIRRTGATREAEQYLAELLEQRPNEASLHFQMGSNIADYDRARANIHFEKAVELEPDNLKYVVGLAESLGRSRHGDEAANLERAHQIMLGVLDRLPHTAPNLKIAYELMVRLAAYGEMDRLGSFSEIGRTWANAGRHTALLAHLARVKTPEDRLDLVEQHRIWGRLASHAARQRPIAHRGPRQPNGKIRIGFMSSDLRAHPVAYFALPLFQHYDRSRFEVYCYSFFQGEEDASQKAIAGWVDAFRWRKDISDRDAAQMIADDQLDMLIELGGSTHMNKLLTMSYKPAPLSASWLGYPHSAGLEEIDHLILDPFVAPPKRELLIEEPLLMPKSWIAMGELAFPPHEIKPGTPQERNGFLTIGTANNPYKYGREMVQTWARITAQIPDARFLFVRPEGNAPSFRRNLLELFAAEGVSEDRVRFEAVRGAHMPFYNDIDMSLDSFPQTGGTTTCEALWMGVPVVTLTGEAMFERLSHSILNNAGLADLCAASPEAYVEIALQLAADHERRKALRTDLRGMLKASPLGQTQQFAVDFFEMVEGAVARAKAAGKIPAAA